jgi:hypothetical protein
MTAECIRNRVPLGGGLARNGNDHVTLDESGLGGRRRGAVVEGGYNGCHLGGDLADAACQNHPGKDQVGDQEVHTDPGQHNDRLRPERLLPVGASEVGWTHLFKRIHPDDPNVATEGNQLDAVFRLSFTDRPQLRPEAEEELGRLHLGRLGGNEMPGLVGHHEEDDREDCREGTQHETGPS